MRYMLLIVEARDLDEAISIAARRPGVRGRRCAIEVLRGLARSGSLESA
jgi:hypothetical protein